MKRYSCSECGAVLEGRPDSCPLCGEALHSSPKVEKPEVPGSDDYQARVRELREELNRLRESGAEAV